jgi:hypothetical protein
MIKLLAAARLRECAAGADPAKARALALENSPAGSPEAEAKAAREAGLAK